MTVRAEGGVQVDIRWDYGDGNDPVDVLATLPIVPRRGDTLCVWIEEPGSYSREEYLEVKDVVLYTWTDDRIEVWVSTDGHPREDLERIERAIKDREVP